MTGMESKRISVLRPQVDPAIFRQPEYDTKGQFCSYWHQINEIVALQPESVLEIGVGSGFVSNYLTRHGIALRTLDLDWRLCPEVGGSILNVPFKCDTFDVISCCQVLEHLPYCFFEEALNELYRVCRKHVVLSLPQDVRRTYRLLIELPRLKSLQRILSVPVIKRSISPFYEKHYWEIGINSYPLKRILADMHCAGFRVRKTYRVFEKLYHRFIILDKTAGS
jgi:SAM-dependent methyltransferase